MGHIGDLLTKFEVCSGGAGICTVLLWEQKFWQMSFFLSSFNLADLMLTVLILSIYFAISACPAPSNYSVDLPCPTWPGRMLFQSDSSVCVGTLPISTPTTAVTSPCSQPHEVLIMPTHQHAYCSYSWASQQAELGAT